MSKSIFILVAVALTLMLINLLAKMFLSKIYKEADEFIEKLDEQQSFIPPTKNEENTNRVVLKVNNDQSSSKRDFNDKQNLTKYNKNTYRAKNGRFKSVKNATK